MIKNVQIPLWTKPHIKINKINLSNNTAHHDIEASLKNKFSTNKEPVLISSARVGIIIALLVSKIKKDELIEVFPYSSFCVNNAIRKVANPICAIKNNNSSKKIIYHFWGNISQTKVKNILLEDAVDTFCIPGVKICEFGGKFELWSLSKILGTIGGGVLWCSNKEIANYARQIRDMRFQGTNIRWIFRFLSSRNSYFSRYWFNQELLGGPLPNWALNQIGKALCHWDYFLSERKQRIYLLNKYDKNLLNNHKYRLPTAVPLKLSNDQISLLRLNGYCFNLLHYPMNNKLVLVLPLPIHQKFPKKEIKNILRIIS